MGEPTSQGALDGLRVLDFCRLGFGSQATMILGCLGAEVIRIESSTRPDPIRVMPPFVPEPGETGEGFGGATLAQAQKQQSANRGGIFYKYNTGGKRSIAVDARNPDGIDLLRQLVAVSDVVTESFAAGTLARWGLDYDTLRGLRPDIIYVSMCGYGHVGPDSHYVTMGPTARSAHRAHASRRASRPRTGGLVVQLPRSRRWLPRRLRGVDRTRAPARDRGRPTRRRVTTGAGNRARRAVGARPVRERPLIARAGFPPGNRRGGAPQGAYRALGEDRWVVISCSTDDHWYRFVAASGHPAWADDDRFATLAGRVEHADDLDRLVETWTESRDRYEIMDLLQRAGVPAGAVQDAADRVERDPQLAARGQFTRLASTEVGELPLEGVPFTLSATPPDTGGTIHRGPPDLGEDRDYVLRDVLGLDADQVERLAASGALQ